MVNEIVNRETENHLNSKSDANSKNELFDSGFR